MLSKYYWSATGIVVIGSAIGIPVGVKYISNGEGSQSPGNTVSIESCKADLNTNQQIEVNFGESNTKSVCGKLKDSSPESGNESEFTNFFNDHGAQMNIEGKSNLRKKGTNQCLGDTKQPGGVITTSDSEVGNNYLGLCEESNKEVKKFIRKEKTAHNSWTFQTCRNDCWTTTTEIGKIKTFNAAKDSNGKEVKFYKNEKIIAKRN